ncbi:1-phosphofructokinase [Haloarcula pellucida]|uniref:1-phosphofructokinase n=1 Tax=Haloarcula pellucida TaxID=1427151 RepID=A0A830GKI0_9EURY|nr:1-phosphofructokinase [Halomicroarcula pellucida]MBX0347749.1 1-phosphofructokinase [Halomicroarcula pellucida]GGN90123.1 1-phosphofructokinase [Halomicroarcula pellucida]
MIVTVTFNPAVDQTIQFDEPMAPDHVMRATDARFDAAGKGINVAQFLTALDTDCAATGIVGGFTGEFIRDELAADGVETAFVEVDGTTRLNTTALATDAEYKLNHDGPTVDDAVVDATIDRIRSNDPEQVVVSGSLTPGVSLSDVDAVAAAGDWDTVVDMEGRALRELDEQYALCKPNREELGEATGADVSTVEGCARAADAFRDRGFDRVLASMGGDGAVLATGSTLLYAEALDVDVVGTVGAGDALLSGVLAAWDAGADDAAALQNGVAVSSRLVEQAGTAVPALDDVAALRERVTVRELDG